MTNEDFPTRTLRINYDLLESVLLGFLYSNNLIRDKEMAIGVDLAIEVDDDNFVEIDIVYESEPTDYKFEDYHLQDGTINDV